MKKILTLLLIAILLSLPHIGLAAFGATWQATSTTQGWITPGKINGIFPDVVADMFIGTSTTGASIFPYASTTVISSTGNAYFGTSGGGLAIGTTSPFATLAVNPTAGKFSNEFVVGSSTATAFIIDNTGQVGIGTVAPTAKLNVQGTSVAARLVLLRLANNGAGVSTAASLGFSFSGSVDPSYISAPYVSSGTQLQFATGGGGGSANADGTVRVTFDGVGNVGIGSSTPFATLAVNPLAGAASNKFAVGSSTATSFIVDNTGNVGIGTASPLYPLHISYAGGLVEYIAPTTGTNSAYIYMQNTGNAALFGIESSGGGAIFNNTLPYATAFGTQSTRAFQLATNNRAEFTVLSGGNTGIGTTSPGSKLTVNGDTYIAGAIFSTSTVTFTALTAFTVGDSAVCQRTGGLVTVDSGVSSCIVSTKAAKHDIKSSETVSSLERIMKLNPVAFEYNEGNKPDIGLIAEEVAAVDARYAQYDPKTLKPKAINWAAITSDLIKTTQDQEKRISALEKLNGIKPDRGSVLPTVFGGAGLLALGAGGAYLSKKKKLI